MSFPKAHIAALRLCSSDVARTGAWLKFLLDFAPVEEMSAFVSFELAKGRLEICRADTKNPTSTGGSIGYLHVEDLDLILRRNQESGGSVFRGPLDVPEIQRRIVQLRGPCGMIVGFESVV